MKTKYAVIQESMYYQTTDELELDKELSVLFHGSWQACSEYVGKLWDSVIQLKRNEAHRDWFIAEIIDGDVSKQEYMDIYVDWEDCPDFTDEDGNPDHDKNFIWAQNEAIRLRKNMYVWDVRTSPFQGLVVTELC